jgi:hypothetical protein
MPGPSASPPVAPELRVTPSGGVKDSLEWWQLISEKRCDGYSHSQEDGYNEARKAFLQ